MNAKEIMNLEADLLRVLYSHGNNVIIDKGILKIDGMTDETYWVLKNMKKTKKVRPAFR